MYIIPWQSFKIQKIEMVNCLIHFSHLYLSLKLRVRSCMDPFFYYHGTHMQRYSKRRIVIMTVQHERLRVRWDKKYNREQQKQTTRYIYFLLTSRMRVWFTVILT